MHPLSALSDPTRRRIVELLAVRERTAGELVAEFDMTSSAISQHLKVLRRVGLVRVRVEGQHRVQMLSAVAVAEMEDWLARVSRALEKQMGTPASASAREPASAETESKRRSRAKAAARQKVASKE